MLQIRVLLTVLMTTLKCCCGNDEKVAWHAGTSMAKAVLFISVLVKKVHSVCGNVSALCFSECMLYFSEMCKKQNHYKKRKYQAHIILQENIMKHIISILYQYFHGVKKRRGDTLPTYFVRWVKLWYQHKAGGYKQGQLHMCWSYPLKYK